MHLHMIWIWRWILSASWMFSQVQRLMALGFSVLLPSSKWSNCGEHILEAQAVAARQGLSWPLDPSQFGETHRLVLPFHLRTFCWFWFPLISIPISLWTHFHGSSVHIHIFDDFCIFPFVLPSKLRRACGGDIQAASAWLPVAPACGRGTAFLTLMTSSLRLWVIMDAIIGMD